MKKRKLVNLVKCLEQDVLVLRQGVADLRVETAQLECEKGNAQYAIATLQERISQLEARLPVPAWVYWTPTPSPTAPTEYKITCSASSADPVPHEFVP